MLWMEIRITTKTTHLSYLNFHEITPCTCMNGARVRRQEKTLHLKNHFHVDQRTGNGCRWRSANMSDEAKIITDYDASDETKRARVVDWRAIQIVWVIIRRAEIWNVNEWGVSAYIKWCHFRWIWRGNLMVACDKSVVHVIPVGTKQRIRIKCNWR